MFYERKGVCKLLNLIRLLRTRKDSNCHYTTDEKGDYSHTSTKSFLENGGKKKAIITAKMTFFMSLGGTIELETSKGHILYGKAETFPQSKS